MLIRAMVRPTGPGFNLAAGDTHSHQLTAAQAKQQERKAVKVAN
jgi:hypothetical protein